MTGKRSSLVIVGPTASGKTELALRVARQFDGEIIAADSRTIYRGMDIGTAKPSKAEQAAVPHHLIDIVNPDQPYSASQFKQDALAAVTEIRSRNKLPILAGGTGLYVWSVAYDYQFPPGASTKRRKELEDLPTSELAERLQQADPEAAERIDLQNPRRIVRALELAGHPRIAPKAIDPSTVMVGIDPGMEELEKRILIRTHQMLDAGLVKEVERLVGQYNPVVEPLNTVGYRETINYLNEEIASEQELQRLITLHTRQLAKRQLTWFKRSPDIRWAHSVDRGEVLAQELLAGKV